MTTVHPTLLVAVFLSALGICHNSKNTYIAAVVDYNHEYAEYAKELLSMNLEQHLKIMRDASKEYPNIIVFPEYGFVDIYTWVDKGEEKKLKEYTTFIPDPELKIIPCEDTHFQNYSMALVNLSCAAGVHSMYTVINLPEKTINNETGELEFYNTNVVFDRHGAVIARYRKINLSDEPYFTAGDEIVTFSTDFGVTFGIFTCFDILFQKPALDILDYNITDIIFTTAWFSETPFLQALSIQHGYAKANGINMLVAGLQEPWNSDGGSAIYLADGSIADLYITNIKKSKLIIEEVPIVESKANNTCSNIVNNKTVPHKPRKYEHLAESNQIDAFRLRPENLTDFTFEPLDSNARTYKTVCNKGFCCNFNISIYLDSPTALEYDYKLAVFDGLSNYGRDYLGAIRVCALIACLEEGNIDTCGQKVNTTMSSLKFNSIEIKTVQDKNNDTYFQPSTLRSDLIPISDYTFCEETNDTHREIRMVTLVPQESFITFGIYGRVYSQDTHFIPPTPAPMQPLNYTLIIMIVSFSVIVMICSAGLLYRYCMKQD